MTSMWLSRPPVVWGLRWGATVRFELAAGEAGVRLSPGLAMMFQTIDREIARGSKRAVTALDREFIGEDWRP